MKRRDFFRIVLGSMLAALSSRERTVLVAGATWYADVGPVGQRIVFTGFKPGSL